MIRRSLWLPLDLIVVCSSRWYDGVAQQCFFMFVVTYSTRLSTSEFYDSICSLLRHCTSFFRQEVNFSCIKEAVLLMGDEKKEKKKRFSAFFCWLFTGRRNCRNQKRCWGLLSVCSDKPPSARMTHAHTLANICTHVRMLHFHAVPRNLLSPNYSRLEPMLLSLILSVQGLWGNSDISVWCLPYVSRALPGPIKLIFNVCPTLDGPSQGWHSSRGDMIGVW